ncbi:hypothetical protein Tco_0481046 [Tanacetum coccineum]
MSHLQHFGLIQRFPDSLLIPTPPPSPLSSWYKVGESSSAAAARSTGGFRADYGFVATMDREIKRDLEIDVGYGITDTCDEMQDTNEIYVRLDDEQTEGQLMAVQLNMQQIAGDKRLLQSCWQRTAGDMAVLHLGGTKGCGKGTTDPYDRRFQRHAGTRLKGSTQLDAQRVSFVLS